MLSQLNQRRPPLVWALCSFILVLTGCPRRFDPEAAPRPQTANTKDPPPCGALVRRGDRAKADACLARLGNGDDVLLRRAMLALRMGKPQEAIELLRPLAGAHKPTAVRVHASYHLGIALLRVGKYQEANNFLVGIAHEVQGGARVGLAIARASIAVKTGDSTLAVALLQRVHGLSERASERQWARDSMRPLLRTLSLKALRRLFAGSEKTSLLRAMSAEQLMARAKKRGDHATAKTIARQARDAITHHGAMPQHGHAQPHAGGSAVLLALPLSGRHGRVGRQAADAGLFAATPGKVGVALDIHDTSNPSKSGSTSPSSRMGIVGGLTDSESRTLMAMAKASDTPWLSLTRAIGGGISMLPSPTARAAALATHARRNRARRTLVLYPAGRYGRRMYRHYSQAFKRLGGTIAAGVSYPPNTRSFAASVAQLKGLSFDAIFVPDRAATLGLLVPALTSAGLSVSHRPPQKDVVLLLATADGLRPKHLRRISIPGAIVAPGFFAPAELSAKNGASMRRYQSKVGRLPSVLEALTHDAVQLLWRARNKKAILEGRHQAWTGTLTFAADGTRSDPGRIYTVVGQTVTPLDSVP